MISWQWGARRGTSLVLLIRGIEFLQTEGVGLIILTILGIWIHDARLLFTKPELWISKSTQEDDRKEWGNK